MYYAYIIQSEKTKKFYIGSCESFDERFKRHNGGRVRVTRNGIPWKVVHLENFLTRQQAYKRERQIKNYKGGEVFKNLVRGGVA